MIPRCPSKEHSYGVLVDGVFTKFLRAPNDIEVSTHTVDVLVESYESSWGTMVTLRALRTSTAKETSFLNSSHFL